MSLSCWNLRTWFVHCDMRGIFYEIGPFTVDVSVGERMEVLFRQGRCGHSCVLSWCIGLGCGWIHRILWRTEGLRTSRVFGGLWGGMGYYVWGITYCVIFLLFWKVRQFLIIVDVRVCSYLTYGDPRGFTLLSSWTPRAKKIIKKYTFYIKHHQMSQTFINVIFTSRYTRCLIHSKNGVQILWFVVFMKHVVSN